MADVSGQILVLVASSIKLQKMSHVGGHQISLLLICEDFVAAARGVDLIYSTLVLILRSCIFA